MFSPIFIKSAVRDYDVNFTNAENVLQDNFFYVVDSNIYKYYPNLFLSFEKIIILESSEQNKNYSAILFVIERLQELGLRRSTTIVAIGGGIIQDIVCFIASIYMRGVDWIFIPTTLLSQTDSCIGSKSSINTDKTKNLLGTFYPPKSIYIDINFLSTLNKIEIKSGIGEMIKVFNLFNHDILSQLEADYDKLINDKLSIKKYIYDALILKKKIIEIDEFDQSERLVMNYGHSFGHAIEKATNYQIPHGIAVCFGMDIANFISFKMKFISKACYIKHKEILSKNYAEYENYPINFENFYIALDGDKKNTKDFFNFILYKNEITIELYSILKSNKIKDILKEYFIEVFK